MKKSLGRVLNELDLKVVKTWWSNIKMKKTLSWEDYKIQIIFLVSQIPRPLDQYQFRIIMSIRGITALSLSKMGDAKVKKIIRKLKSYKDLNEYKQHLNRQKDEKD